MIMTAAACSAPPSSEPGSGTPRSHWKCTPFPGGSRAIGALLLGGTGHRCGAGVPAVTVFTSPQLQCLTGEGVLSQGQSTLPGVHIPCQQLGRGQESGQRSSPGLTQAPSARTGTKENQKVLANPLWHRAGRGWGRQERLGSRSALPAQGCFPVGWLSWGEPGRGMKWPWATLFFCPSPALLPSKQPLCFGELMSARGHNPKVPGHLGPFLRTVGGHVSCSHCLCHGETWSLVLPDRSWLNGRRKMGTKGDCRAGHGIHLPA